MLLSGTVVATANAAGPTYLSDCVGTASPPACGTPNARWDTSHGAIPFCTSQVGRPAGIGAVQFEESVRAAVGTWNAAGAQIVAIYVGDCVSSAPGALAAARTEVRFDVTGTVLGATEGAKAQVQMSLSPSVNPTTRTIIQAEIIIGERVVTLDPTCFGDVVVHEMGHTLGLGHSADVGDVMYPVLRSAAGGCTAKPSAQEYEALRSLYGAAVAPPDPSLRAATAPAALAKPDFGQGRLALALFPGGTLEQLEGWARTADATGLALPDARGVLRVLILGAPSFVNADFRASFPNGWDVAKPVILVR